MITLERSRRVWYSPRRWPRTGARGRLVLAAALSLAVTATVQVALPAPASAAGPYPWRTPQQLDPVPTVTAAPSKPADNLAARLASRSPSIPAPVWPVAGVVEADLTEPATAGRPTPSMRGVDVVAGGLAVRVGPVSDRAGDGVRRVRVESVDRHAVAAPGGRAALLVRLSRADGATTAGKVSVAVDYTKVAGAYGGDWAGRLRAAVLPECALTGPAATGCRPVPVPSWNDRSTGRVVAEVSLPGASQSPAAGSGSVILALLAGDSSTSGDYTATSLKPSATWSGGGSTGDFTWSYPLRVPPSLGGPSPQVELSYSSQSLDGLTSATNNQPSWLGDGFAYDAGFIERTYTSCVDDGHPGTGDLCWGSDNVTMSMSGHGGELIQYSTSPDLWRPVHDDGTRIERIRDTATANADNDGEYWKVTTTDGTQYFFGRNRLTGWTTGKPETNSVSYVPVFGDDPGEPCHDATYANAWCQQAYRWHLDHVVDTHANTMSYWYARQTNNYARNATPASVSTYVRASHLARIEYANEARSGVDTAYTATAPARVTFTVADRCQLPTGCQTHDAAHWPDVPWDRECASATSCPGTYAPTFWTTQRLSTVTTQVATGPNTWKDVDSWALGVEWITPGAGDQTMIMWLTTVTQTGRNGAAPDITLPPVVFAPTATIMANRVNSGDGNGAFRRYRLGTIANETGGVVGITYSPADCVPGSKMPAAPESNTYRCFPAYWTPPGGSQILDYYHKYVVSAVSTADNAGGNPTGVTTYGYPSDGAFWHYDESELTPPGRKTWGQWRGYDQVTVTQGAVEPGEPPQQTVTS